MRWLLTPAWIRSSSFLITASLLISACSSPSPGAPQAWIDAPMHNSTHPIGPIEIVLHASDPAGVAAVEVKVNGEVLTSPAPDNPAARLVTIRSQWNPTEPGEYLLSARAQNRSGAWGPSTRSKVILTGPLAAQPPATETPSPSPTLTQTSTAESSPTSTSTPACVDKAGFVADLTVPDNTTMMPGAAFTKAWRIRNDGTCPWDETYRVVFVGGEPMNNAAPVSFPGVIPPGSSVDIRMSLIAPTAPGTYRSNYRIESPLGAVFGVGSDGQTPFHVQIIVQSPSTVTPTSPPQPDAQPPTVNVSHAPAGDWLPTGSMITFTANASDNVGVVRIDLWVTAPGQWPTLVKTCNNTGTCSYTGGPYSTQGTLSYFAVASDAAGNQTNSGAKTISLYIVVPLAHVRRPA